MLDDSLFFFIMTLMRAKTYHDGVNVYIYIYINMSQNRLDFLPSVQFTLALPINLSVMDLTLVVSWQLSTTEPLSMTPADSSTLPCKMMWSFSMLMWKSDVCTSCMGFESMFILLYNDVRCLKDKQREEEEKEKLHFFFLSFLVK